MNIKKRKSQDKSNPITTTVPSKSIPSLPNRFPLGHAPDLQKDVLGFFDRCRATYGNLYAIPIPGVRAFATTNPDLVQKMFLETEKNFIKSPQMKRFSPLIGNGLATSEGAFWKRQRKLATPFFTASAVTSFEGHIRISIEETLTKWEQSVGSELDLNEEMAQLTLRIILRSLFSGDGIENSDLISSSIMTLSKYLMKRFFAPVLLPLSLSFLLHPEAKRAHRQLHTLVYDLIRVRRKTGSEGKKDMLSMFLSAQDPDTGETMNDEQIHDELLTMFFAGFDTTSSALIFAFRLLSENPEQRERLEAEADRLVSNAIPTPEEVRSFDVIRRAFEETMRLYPPGYILNRSPIDDYLFEDYLLPAGALVFIPIWTLHRSPELWQKPTDFDPDRFLKENVQKRHRCAYVPFATGRRMCIGSNLAMLEGQMIIGSVVKNFRLAHRANHTPIIKPAMALNVVNGMPMKVEKR
ncbi:MAG: cytochrome P450, partial [Spirochaetota bacterium]